MVVAVTLLLVVSNLYFNNRYEGAVERKAKILEIVRTLDLPNNPLDDIIDQVVACNPLFLSVSLCSHACVLWSKEKAL